MTNSRQLRAIRSIAHASPSKTDTYTVSFICGRYQVRDARGRLLFTEASEAKAYEIADSLNTEHRMETGGAFPIAD